MSGRRFRRAGGDFVARGASARRGRRRRARARLKTTREGATYISIDASLVARGVRSTSLHESARGVRLSRPARRVPLRRGSLRLLVTPRVERVGLQRVGRLRGGGAFRRDGGVLAVPLPNRRADVPLELVKIRVLREFEPPRVPRLVFLLPNPSARRAAPPRARASSRRRRWRRPPRAPRDPGANGCPTRGDP